ncbi:MAG: long-chain fatty acid--CoA ligase [Deltaproteobacteria bacterium]|nr:long-chain fatty acid--CoA ligase [Deltaproteobacteria bacterium]MBP7286010.1 long-chain fatty acid--CoA ligase [Nannocystaceae bacterium]
MDGTMMGLPLTLDQLVERAAEQYAAIEVVSRRPDRSVSRTTYRAVVDRARRLAAALVAAGVRKGECVATLMWNHAEHLEAYLGIPLAGAVVHTLNLRLHPDEIAFIAADGGARTLIVDAVLLPLFAKFADKVAFERVIVVGEGELPPGAVAYEAWLAAADPSCKLPQLAEHDASGCCYTSGTTGKPKGVVYTHRSTMLHSLVSALPDCFGLSRADVLLPVVPMFHVNAWGLPYTATMVGAKLVFPGPHLDAASVLDLMRDEGVTIAAGVPTIWLGIRDALEAEPGRWPLREGVRMVVGGSAAPQQLIRDFDRHGLRLIHAWGMTETSPLGLVSRVPPHLADAPEALQLELRAKQGTPPPLVRVRVCNDAGVVPQDGRTSGEVQVRGPWVTARYAGIDVPDRWTADGWFRTGDVAHVDAHGFVQLTDRMADLIKSGGEWIASAELENALMCHPEIREAAVVGVPHPRWSERPVAVIVPRAGKSPTDDALREFLAPRFPKYWLPDAFVVVEEIPRTSAGKFKKTELRERLRNFEWP